MSTTTFILQDNREVWKQLLPLTFTRPVSSLRIGIDTIAEKWQHFLHANVEIDTEDYLMKKFGNKQNSPEESVLINSSIVPNKELVNEILSLNVNETLQKEEVFVARKYTEKAKASRTITASSDFIQINHPWDLFTNNEQVLKEDFERFTKGRQSQELSSTNQVKEKEKIFIEPGAEVEFSILNAERGPIYIGKNATILEGSMVKGPLALCENAVLKMGAKIYGATTLGPYCKFGGEVNNVIGQAYSNKGHDGYLGNAVIGEWCNLGADTNASNMKNNYGMVKAFNYYNDGFINTNRQFLGLIMGDHSKCGINTMFNTATVVGVAANIFGGGFPPKHIPSFTWGAIDRQEEFRLEKAFEMAESMMKRREIIFSEVDKEIFHIIFDETKKYRN